MKKIYAVYCIVKLTKQPEWLDNFRKKYDEAYDFHITLKQAAYIEDWQISDIRKILDGILTNFEKDKNNIELKFENLVLDEKGGYIYLFANSNQIIDNLQKKIRNSLKIYSRYINPKSIKYEYNFKPHITIARDLNKQRFAEAKSVMGQDYMCEGRVVEIVLSCVKEISVEEAHNPENLTNYKI